MPYNIGEIKNKMVASLFTSVGTALAWSIGRCIPYNHCAYKLRLQQLRFNPYIIMAYQRNVLAARNLVLKGTRYYHQNHIK